MADKRITDLGSANTIVATDLFLIVGNNATSPTNWGVKANNIFTFPIPVRLDLPADVETNALTVVANVAANATHVQAAAEFRLLAGNAVIGGTKSYGVIVHHTVANVAGNKTVKAPVAFLGFKDAVGTNGNATTYLFAAGIEGNVVTSCTAVNATTMLAVTNNQRATPANSVAATHTIRVQINGADYWLLATNVSPTA